VDHFSGGGSRRRLRYIGLLVAPFAVRDLVKTNYAFVMNLLEQPLTFYGYLVLAMLFYRLRGVNRLTYGLVEVYVGTITIFFTAGLVNDDFLKKMLGLMTGIYIVVRGLDNIDNDLPYRWRRKWDSFFPKNTSRS
jgi:hypothetical protein